MMKYRIQIFLLIIFIYHGKIFLCSKPAQRNYNILNMFRINSLELVASDYALNNIVYPNVTTYVQTYKRNVQVIGVYVMLRAPVYKLYVSFFFLICRNHFKKIFHNF